MHVKRHFLQLMVHAYHAIDVDMVMPDWITAQQNMCKYAEVVTMYLELYQSRKCVLEKKFAHQQNSAGWKEMMEKRTSLTHLAAENTASVRRWTYVEQQFCNLSFCVHKTKPCVETRIYFRTMMCDLVSSGTRTQPGAYRFPNKCIPHIIATWIRQILVECFSPRILVNSILSCDQCTIQISHPAAQGTPTFFSPSTLLACNTQYNLKWTLSDE